MDRGKYKDNNLTGKFTRELPDKVKYMKNTWQGGILKKYLTGAEYKEDTWLGKIQENTGHVKIQDKYLTEKNTRKLPDRRKKIK